MLLTGLAILLYPGGSTTDPQGHGFNFFTNFLSDLGRTSTPSGQENQASHLLFTLALILGACAITLYFAAFTQFFVVPGPARWLSRVAAVCALVTSLGFIGVALIPLDRLGLLQDLLIYTASLTTILAFLLLFVAVLLTPTFPRRGVQVLTAFAVLMAGSLLVLLVTFLFVPTSNKLVWEVLQATGQKLLVAAAILAAFFEALFVQPLLVKKAEPPSNS